MIPAKILWVTGASSGIGEAVVIAAARAGFRVYASARRLDKLKKTVEMLSQEGHFAFALPCDIRNRFDVESTANMIASKEPLFAFVNAAGITSFKNAVEDPLDSVENIIQTNLLGAVYAMKSVLPGMVQNKEGIILNILSVVTKKIFTQSSAYSASKAGLLAYTNSLREEVRKENIRVINIIPGAADTPIWHDSVREKHGARMMKPEDIAHLIVEILRSPSTAVIEEMVLRPVLGDL